MKKDIHPDYRPVVFQDVSTGYSFLTRSTVETDRTIQWEDGKEYPLLTLEISSASHPFYTGTQRLLDSAGRVERFERRYARAKGGAKSDPAAEAEASAGEADDTAE
ncbi:MAG: type B 50S ribosomal protein L31 [Gemmatimonadota bacterium]|nr:type B 50S ribosomal protein L31 [Gemmatimonadota bacterium]